MHICTHTHTHMHARTHAHTHARTHAHMHARTDARTHTHTHLTHTHTHTSHWKCRGSQKICRAASGGDRTCNKNTDNSLTTHFTSYSSLIPGPDFSNRPGNEATHTHTGPFLPSPQKASVWDKLGSLLESSQTGPLLLKVTPRHPG